MIGMLQHVVPLLAACVLSIVGVADIESYEDIWVIRMKESFMDYSWIGFTYGSFIFLTSVEFVYSEGYESYDNWFLQHEYGHVLQQRILGAWYPIVAVPSFITEMFFHRMHEKTIWELWANQLSGYEKHEMPRW
jgi:hypothetical protein